MNTIEPRPPATAGMRAYAVWHGMTIKHVQDEWASVPQADRMRAKWEAVGAAIEAAERERWLNALALPHYYGGNCPDQNQPTARDPEHCAACRALVELGA